MNVSDEQVELHREAQEAAAICSKSLIVDLEGITQDEYDKKARAATDRDRPPD